MASRLSPDWLECFAFIRQQSLQGRALVVPRVSFPPLVYYTPLVMVSSGHGSKAMTFDRLTIRQRLTDPGAIGGLVRELGVRYVLVDRTAAPPALRVDESEWQGHGLRPLFTAGTVLLLEGPGAADLPSAEMPP
jgi:hypothetical protein